MAASPAELALIMRTSWRMAVRIDAGDLAGPL